jgi:DNA adenine methylase
VRYQGGKVRTARKIANSIGSGGGNGVYFEPFLGGGSVAAAIAEAGNFSTMYLGDAQPDLIALWKKGLRGWVPPSEMPKVQYERLRQSERHSALRGWAAFAASHSGKYFGGYGVSSGDRNYLDESVRLFMKKILVLQKQQKIILRCQRYGQWIPKRGDTVYADPPYASTETYGALPTFDQDKFWCVMERWARLGVSVFVSEYAAPNSWESLWSVERAATLDPSSSKRKIESLFVYRGKQKRMKAKKKSTGIPRKAGVQKPLAKHKRYQLQIPEPRKRGWAVLGFDLSLSGIAGAGVGYDSTLDKYVGPAFISRRFEKDDDYFSRLEFLARAEEIVQDLILELKLILGNDEIYIAIEEPFPPHTKFTQKGQGKSLKQQAEMSGAFLGGLARWGYGELWQIHNTHWRKLVADDLGTTLHPPKWKDPALCAIYNCAPRDAGKFRAKQWAMMNQGYAWQGVFGEIPDYPDMIQSKNGKIPRPKKSKAKAFQPDDRYDALAIMEFLHRDLVESETIESGV